MRAKHVALLVPTVLVGLVGAFFLVSWLWFNVFYFHDFNALRKELTSVPNLQIVYEWRHEDITLEDCGFTVTVANSEAIALNFYDVSSWRRSFEPLDGIVVSLPYGRTSNESARTALSLSDLHGTGVKADSLPQVLQNIDKILALARSRPLTTESLGIRGNWVTIYSNGEPSADGTGR